MYDIPTTHTPTRTAFAIKIGAWIPRKKIGESNLVMFMHLTKYFRKKISEINYKY